VSRILLGSPAVVDVVRFTDLAALRQALGDAIARVTKITSDQAPDAVVQRFLGSLGAARQLPEAEVAALLRVAELDGEPASAIRRAIADGKLFGAGLRDLVGRHALRGGELAAFVPTPSSSGPSPRSLARSARTRAPYAGGWSSPGSSCSWPLTPTSRS
jgi:hypothetical protein